MASNQNRLIPPQLDDADLHVAWAGPHRRWEAQRGGKSLGSGHLTRARTSMAATAFYRLRSSRIPGHFFTTSLVEREYAIANLNFVNEGIAGFVLPALIPGTVPLHRLYHATIGDHFFTTSDAERDNAIAQLGYHSEGEACFVFPTQAQGTQPLHRLRNTSPGTGDHFYTTSDAERDTAIANLNFVSEGEACFVFAGEPSAFYHLFPRP